MDRLLPTNDRNALGALLERLQPRLTAVAHRFTRDRDTAEDVVQNAFEKVLRHGHRFRGDSQVSTWLHRIVANEALMWLRLHRRRSRLAGELEEADEASLADSRPDALEHIAGVEREAHVRACLASLAPEEREVLIHCSLHEKSYEEFAAERGLHPAAVKSRAFRARRRLGTVLGGV